MNEPDTSSQDSAVPADVASPPGLADHMPSQTYVVLDDSHLRSRKRLTVLPVVLFLLTCVSTFLVGALGWPLTPTLNINRLFHATLTYPGRGFTYMACVLAILFAHEMGHFVATVIHRVPASLPFFIPFPLNPMGTMGAVIAMDGRQGDRRQVFDIGIAGPLAGLVVAIPILVYGVFILDVSRPIYGASVDNPLLVDLLINWIHPSNNYTGALTIRQLNPFFMAGWVGLLITGLNMMPVSQLDGGHVIYTLFGRRRALIVARMFVFTAIFLIVMYDAFNWTLMLFLVILIGTDHPRTRNDYIPLGRTRTIIGLSSLVIPIFCFPPFLFYF
ncbi:MAG: site-2 protease family protein [Planctomycetales bacterium]|nr:site-2 protease family protein [Planctomycetales bacterium]